MIKSKIVRLAGHVACVETLSYKNSMSEEIKSCLKPENARYHSVQNGLSFSLLFKYMNIKNYKTTNLSVVLYVCETWSSKSREEQKLMISEKRVLKRIFWPKRYEVIGSREERLHKEEIDDLYSSAYIIRVIKSRKMRWAYYAARMEEGRGVYRVWVGRPEWNNHSEELSVNENISSRSGLGTWTELIWLGTGTGCRILSLL
jgi:hypothetical protein